MHSIGIFSAIVLLMFLIYEKINLIPASLICVLVSFAGLAVTVALSCIFYPM